MEFIEDSSSFRSLLARISSIERISGSSCDWSTVAYFSSSTSSALELILATAFSSKASFSLLSMALAEIDVMKGATGGMPPLLFL